MDGLLFYFLSWSLWVYLTFIAEKSSEPRIGLASAVLASIILSPIHVTVGTAEVYAGGLFLFLYSISFLRSRRKREIVYFYSYSLIISIAYSVSQFFGLFDPVVFIIKKEWMAALAITLLALILQKSLKWRVLLILFGTVQGELLTAVALNNNSLHYEAGGLAYLDNASLIIMLILAWGGLERISSWLETWSESIERSKKLPHD